VSKVYGNTITSEQIEEVNKYMGYDEGSRLLTNFGYAFYYNQMQNDLDVCDADRYANLNTVLGYETDIETFRALDCWLWEHEYDLLELTGSESDKDLLRRATREAKIKDLDYSKWNDLAGEQYTYSFFENGVKVEGGIEKKDLFHRPGVAEAMIKFKKTEEEAGLEERE